MNIRIVILIFIMSCENAPKSINNSDYQFFDLKKATYEGNIEAYNKLSTTYLDYSPEDFLFWAMLMANKNDYPQANLDVFYALVNAYVGGIENVNMMDERTYDLALEYLTRASQKGVKEADLILIEIDNHRNKVRVGNVANR